ncbi:MAG: hypothetical protein HOL93_03655 [Candidatus Marinimicrobia bacterium]|jgi:hypothetical protein|nr:hypothetical protein [Candidatus Neomarinimicrobiota bacterium]
MYIEMRKTLIMLLFVFSCILYFTLSIPSNSIWMDQTMAINIAKDIIDGNFPLVGYVSSNGMHTFPVFYYLVAPLVYISEEPIFLYWSVAFFNIVGIILLANYTFKKYGYLESIILLLFSATHVWSLYFSSFFWNPNYIPFFMCMFIIFLSKLLNESKSVIYFHLSGILINIVVQMMPQAIILIPAFIFILFIFKKLPSILHQIIHILIQIILVYPWLYYYIFVFNWDQFYSKKKLFKSFYTPAMEYFNFLGGWGLANEYRAYISYGTNTFPNTTIFNNMLFVSGLILLTMLVYSTYLSFKHIQFRDILNIQVKKINELDLPHVKLLIALSIINLSCLMFLLVGMHVHAHHYQFLTPLLALNFAVLVGVENKRKKLIISLLLVSIFIQGSFSYWRAYSEYTKPYVTDIGYSDKFTQYYADNCNADSSAYILDPRGLQFFKSSTGSVDKNACGKVVLVMRDHYAQSEIIRWMLEEEYRKTEMVFKDYMIWSANKDLL